ncbi:MAG: cell division protein FtsZ [Alphaproteobacteria bacterium]|nr:cell division protein FtsZ [Alphaproteobacteria bacterium]
MDSKNIHLPKIAVIGVGGAGINIVKNMQKLGLSGIDFIIANTDAQSLAHADATHKISLGQNLTQGYGAGGDPVIGEKAAQESLDEIMKVLSPYQMVFITSGMGGGTGSGASSIIAQSARDQGILTVGIVTRPFGFEGQKREAVATEAIDKLKNTIDSYLVLHNEKLFDTFDDDVTQIDAFHKADSLITDSLKGLTEILTSHGQINLDFADLRSVLKGAGQIVLNSAVAEDENRAIEVAQSVLNNPLLDQGKVEGAQQVLIQISGGTDVKLKEIKIITDEIRKHLPHFGNLIFGTNFQEELNGKIMVSLIASGLDEKKISFVSKSPVDSLSQFSFAKIAEASKPKQKPEPSFSEEKKIEEKTEEKEAPQEEQKVSSEFDDLKSFFSLESEEEDEDEDLVEESDEMPVDVLLSEEEIVIEEMPFDMPSDSTEEKVEKKNFELQKDLAEEGDLLKMLGALEENKEIPEDLEIPSFLREMKDD